MSPGFTVVRLAVSPPEQVGAGGFMPILTVCVVGGGYETDTGFVVVDVHPPGTLTPIVELPGLRLEIVFVAPFVV